MVCDTTVDASEPHGSEIPSFCWRRAVSHHFPPKRTEQCRIQTQMSFSYGTSLLLKFLHNNFFSDYETRCSIKLNTPCLHSRPLSKQCNVNFLFIGIRKFGELGAHPRIMARFAQKAQAFLERKLRLLSERYSSSDCPHYLHICNLSFPLTELVM